MGKILLLLCCVFAITSAKAYQWGPSQDAAQQQIPIVLYYTPWCPHSDAVLKYLASIHKTIPMKNVDRDPQAREELKILGGKLQVPCLMINSVPLYDSDAIIQWLSEHQAQLQSVP